MPIQNPKTLDSFTNESSIKEYITLSSSDKICAREHQEIDFGREFQHEQTIAIGSAEEPKGQLRLLELKRTKLPIANNLCYVNDMSNKTSEYEHYDNCVNDRHSGYIEPLYNKTANIAKNLQNSIKKQSASRSSSSKMNTGVLYPSQRSLLKNRDKASNSPGNDKFIDTNLDKFQALENNNIHPVRSVNFPAESILKQNSPNLLESALMQSHDDTKLDFPDQFNSDRFATQKSESFESNHDPNTYAGDKNKTVPQSKVLINNDSVAKTRLIINRENELNFLSKKRQADILNVEVIEEREGESMMSVKSPSNKNYFNSYQKFNSSNNSSNKLTDCFEHKNGGNKTIDVEKIRKMNLSKNDKNRAKKNNSTKFQAQKQNIKKILKGNQSSEKIVHKTCFRSFGRSDPQIWLNPDKLSEDHEKLQFGIGQLDCQSSGVSEEDQCSVINEKSLEDIDESQSMLEGNIERCDSLEKSDCMIEKLDFSEKSDQRSQEEKNSGIEPPIISTNDNLIKSKNTTRINSSDLKDLKVHYRNNTRDLINDFTVMSSHEVEINEFFENDIIDEQSKHDRIQSLILADSQFQCDSGSDSAKKKFLSSYRSERVNESDINYLEILERVCLSNDFDISSDRNFSYYKKILAISYRNSTKYNNSNKNEMLVSKIDNECSENDNKEIVFKKKESLEQNPNMCSSFTQDPNIYFSNFLVND